MKVVDIVQLIAALAVFIGLGLVVYELRQTQTLAQAGIMANHWDQVLENERAKLGENPAQTLVKICEPLSQLSQEEREILSANFWINWSMMERTRLIEEIVELGTPWQEYAYHSLRRALSTPMGRHDFAAGVDFDSQTGEEGVVNGWPKEYQPMVEKILQEGVPECGAYWELSESDQPDLSGGM